MRVTVLDDYQHAIEGTEAIQKLGQRAEVQILTEKLVGEDALIRALDGSQAIIPVRERTKFSAALLGALTDLEFISPDRESRLSHKILKLRLGQASLSRWRPEETAPVSLLSD
jgi:D-3-phosphoglycerate dehydrogenase / 2-oxoglutarate reductase